jgi:beta-lactamase superfamily II metal-dependent hydrolase
MKQVTIRMYNVGFGDCFLVTVPTSKGARRILFDCGSMAKAEKPISEIVDQVVGDLGTKPRIDVVVCSHRHRDHITGFASESWNDVDVGEVWMPWTEDPDDPEATRIREAQTGLAATLTRDADARLAAGVGLGAQERAELAAFRELAANSQVLEDAMEMLHGGFKKKAEIPRRFLPEPDAHGKPIRSFTSELLPGVVIHVLGPSKSEEVIRDIEPPKGKSYQQLAASMDDPDVDDAGPEPFSSDWTPTEDPFEVSMAERDKIAAYGHGFRSWMAAALDDAVNGTSLVLLLEVGGKYFLFPGDAQWGTWDAMLRDPAWVKLLKRVNFYKIGHHGSHNATPIEFVESTLDKSLNVVAMASTRKFGSWHVPLPKLLDEMTARNVRIARSDKPKDLKKPAFKLDGDVIETRIDVG